MSLKKIAQLTGTSVSTVSRVLNNPAHCCHSADLAQKIWDTAKELNYLPNSSARELRLGTQPASSPFVVDVFLTRFNSVDQDIFFQELYHYLQEELLAKNCLMGSTLSGIEVMALSADSKKTKAVPYKSTSTTVISRKKHSGLIVFGKCPKEFFPVLKNRYSTIVGIDRNPTDYEYDEVICNGTTAAIKAVEYLISLGHRDIAYLGDCTYESRYIGYYQALLNHKIPLNYENIYPSNQTIEAGERIMSEILNSDHRPTAIFCANDCTALGVLRALKKHKKKGYLPSVISIDNIEESKKTVPMLTTIDIPKKEMVHLALALLLDRKAGGHEQNIRLELPCQLLVRESCNYI